jgi:hypothetical protein
VMTLNLPSMRIENAPSVTTIGLPSIPEVGSMSPGNEFAPAMMRSPLANPNMPIVQRQVDPRSPPATSRESPPIAPELARSAIGVSNAQTLIWRKSIDRFASSASQPGSVSRNGEIAAAAVPSIQSMAMPNLINRMETNGSELGGAGLPDRSMAPAINLDQIVELVSRRLHRQLVVERERRGMDLW